MLRRLANKSLFKIPSSARTLSSRVPKLQPKNPISPADAEKYGTFKAADIEI